MRIRSCTPAGIVMMVVLSAGLTACEFPQACDGLHASQKDREAAANGYEVEREDDQGNTCELGRDGSWEVDD